MTVALIAEPRKLDLSTDFEITYSSIFYMGNLILYLMDRFFEVYSEQLLSIYFVWESGPLQNVISFGLMKWTHWKNKAWYLTFDILGTATVFLPQNTLRSNSTLQSISMISIALLICFHGLCSLFSIILRKSYMGSNYFLQSN